jgi:hypothetical protein
MVDDKGNPGISAANAEGTPAAATAATAAKAPEAATPKLQYFDRNDCDETFADQVTKISFDGQTLRLEFAVTRMDDIRPNIQPTGRVIPICRLVMPPRAAVDLMNRMQQITAGLIQAGYLKQT